ncbi:MAG: AAA family ATPase [Rickettsiales bacterium]|nr:AAA family ATPase [Rickettsiales bacterium]
MTTKKKVTEIISIVNQKGGVGKTTTAINLSTAFAAVGKKVLIIDFDPQGNASTGLGININTRNVSIYDILLNNKDINDGILSTKIPNLDIVTSTMELSAAEIELQSVKKREFRLSNEIDKIKNHYDYVIIDCPPSLGLLTVNALTASNYMLIPTQCEFFALEGLSYLLKTVELVKKFLNPTLRIKGVILTMSDRRNKLSVQVEQEVRKYFNNLVYDTVIPRNIRLAEAPSHGEPALIYDTKSTGAMAYLMLAKEIFDQEKTTKQRRKQIA